MKEKTKAFTIRIPFQMHSLLKELSFYSGSPMGEIMINSLNVDSLKKRTKEARDNYLKNGQAG